MSTFRTLLLFLVVIAAMSLYLAQNLKVQSDISFFLPESKSTMDSVLLHQLSRGESAKIIIIALQSDTPAHSQQLAKINQQLYQALKQSEQFSQVENGSGTTSAAIIEPYYQYRYLLPTMQSEPFSDTTLRDSFIRIQERLQFMLSPLEQKLFQEDPTMTWMSLLAHWQSTQLNKHHGVWFSADKQQSFLFVKTQAEGYELNKQQANIELIKQQLQSRLDTNTRYLLSGAPVFALSSKQAIRLQIQLLSMAASVLLACFLFWYFRSVKILIYAALPAATAILAGLAIVVAIDGFIHGITIAFGITIIGIAIDYPIHYYTHARYQQHASAAAVSRIWPMMRLGLVTTVIGFSAILFSEFSGLKQLGLFAISGLLAAMLTTRWVLPVLPIKSKDSKSTFQSVVKLLPGHQYKLLKPVALLLPVIAIIYILSNQQQLWQNDLSALSPIPQTLKQQDHQLRKAIGLAELRYALVLQNPSLEALLQQSEMLRPVLDAWQANQIITGYDMAANYIPSKAFQQQQQQRLPKKKDLAEKLDAILADTPLSAAAFQPFIDAVTQSQSLAALQWSAQSTADTMLDSKIRTLLYQHNQQWVSLIPLQGVNPAIQTHLVQQQLPVQAELLDLKAGTEQMLSNYRTNALLWFMAGAVLILLIMLFSARQHSGVLALVWPIAGAVVLTVASLMLLDYSLSIFHLVTLLLVVGLGIDYSVFTFFSRSAGNEITNITQASQVSVIICLVSTLIMFGALSLSELPVLNAIGLTTSLGAIYAFLLTQMMNN
jgi:predicted exporter